MKCIKGKSLLLLLLFIFCLLPVSSQDSTSKKQEITNQLLNIKIQLVNLDRKLQDYRKQTEQLEQVILDLKDSIQNSMIISEKLKRELIQQKELLTKLELDYQELQETYNQLLKQSTELLKQLKTLKTWNNVLIGGVITFGAAAIVETLILIFKE